MGLLDKILPPPDKNQFAKMMTEVVVGGGEKRPIKFDVEDFKLIVGDNEFEFHLGQTYQRYLSLPRGQRKEFLRNYSTFTLPRPALSFAEAKEKLLPRVRDRFHLESIRLAMLAQG